MHAMNYSAWTRAVEQACGSEDDTSDWEGFLGVGAVATFRCIMATSYSDTPMLSREQRANKNSKLTVSLVKIHQTSCSVILSHSKH